MTVKPQRFVSRYLTHFVGRRAMEKKSPDREDAQYGTLASILKAGYLGSHVGQTPGVSSYGVMVAPMAAICSNEMIDVSPICFCDIPIDDLGVHMQKYGEFGLCFKKRFLIDRGASPVFYVAMGALVKEQKDGTAVTRGHYFNQMVASYSPLRAFIFSRGGEPDSGEDRDLHELVKKYAGLRDDPALGRLYRRLDALITFIDAHVLGYVKCFDDKLPADSVENFYMEREWRAATRIDFTPADVAFVIVPRQWIERLRKEFPSIDRRRIRASEDCREARA